MTTAESIQLIQTALDDTTSEISKLDSLLTNAQTSEDSIRRLEGEIADLHFNRANLMAKARVSAMNLSATSVLLERGDLERIKSQTDAQSDRVVQYSQRAKSLLAQLWSALLSSRKAAVEQLLQETLDLRQLHTPVSELSAAALCVRELEAIGDSLFVYRYLPDERELALQDARALPPKSASLLATAADELSELAITDVKLVAVTKQKPAPTSQNKLGTMAQAVAA